MSIQFTEAEKLKYKLTEADMTLAENLGRALSGDTDVKVSFAEMLASPSATVLIPRTIIGAMREAAEPLYIASQFFQTIRFNGQGNTMQFPSIGVMRAYDVAEGQEIPEDTIDWQTHEAGTEVRVGKSGLRLRFTDELIQDAQWDIVAMMIREAGRAMARHKEQKMFYNMSRYGHTVFDNNSSDSLAKTRGVGDDYVTPNDTLSAEDFLDMIIALMANEMTPTDVLMHPLTWTVFARSELHQGLSLNPQSLYPATNQPSSMTMGTAAIQGRLPFSFNVQLSPFIPFDKTNKRYDMYVVDRNNVGVLLLKEELSTERFTEPARDIMNMKMKERYGVGILNQGRGVVVAKNLALETSYAKPNPVRQITI